MHECRSPNCQSCWGKPLFHSVCPPHVSCYFCSNSPYYLHILSSYLCSWDFSVSKWAPSWCHMRVYIIMTWLWGWCKHHAEQIHQQGLMGNTEIICSQYPLSAACFSGLSLLWYHKEYVKWWRKMLWRNNEKYSCFIAAWHHGLVVPSFPDGTSIYIVCHNGKTSNFGPQMCVQFYWGLLKCIHSLCSSVLDKIMNYTSL